MKRLICILFLVAGFFGADFAQSEDLVKDSYRITSGGFWSCTQNLSGGFGEFGINLLPKENYFVLRDCIFVMGQGGVLFDDTLDFGALEIGDKLIFGGRYNCSSFVVRSYGYMSWSVKFYSCLEHKLFSAPIISLGFGGGFELQYIQNTAFVLEFGDSNNFLTGKYREKFKLFSNSSPTLTIGFRTFMGKSKKKQ